MRKIYYLLTFCLFLLFGIFTPKSAYAVTCKNLGDFCTAADKPCSTGYECVDGTVQVRNSPVTQVECSVQGATNKGGDVTSCVGGFLTKDEIKNYTLEVGCAGRASGLNLFTTFCWQIPGTNIGNGLTQTFDLAAIVQDKNIGQDANGRYYTCFTGQDSDPNVHDIYFSYRSKVGNAEVCFDHSYTLDKNTPCVNDTCNTALGFISIKTPTAFISNILQLAIGIAGTLALLLMLYGIFTIITAGANAKARQAGQDIIVSAISGLLFIVLSVILLKIMGVDILSLPGLI